MDNRAEQENKSCELVTLQDLINLIKLGFPILPPRQDSKTPNVHSTNDIYNNPEIGQKRYFVAINVFFTVLQHCLERVMLKT
jgi:hypothetical protein